MSNLTQFVKVSDFNELKEIVRNIGIKVEQLVEAQKKTEARLDSLTIKVEQLVEAQKKTEEVVKKILVEQRTMKNELRKVIEEHSKTRIQLGRLSATVGYDLEDKSYIFLPPLLEKDHCIKIIGKLSRGYLKNKENEYLEINIVGRGFMENKEIIIIGECKSQLSKKGIDEFIRKKLNRLKGSFENIFPVLVTYMIAEHDVDEYVKKKGIALYYSYNFIQ